MYFTLYEFICMPLTKSVYITRYILKIALLICIWCCMQFKKNHFVKGYIIGIQLYYFVRFILLVYNFVKPHLF